MEFCKDGEHKFVARYEEKPNPIDINTTLPNNEDVRRLLYYKVYLFDICEKCGKTIYQTQNPKKPI